MAKVADRGAIHFKVLNRSKGPAVYGPRVQQDRDYYKKHMLDEIRNTPNLTIVQGSVDDIIVEKSSRKVTGVVLQNGERISTKSTVITTGTFLGGVLHIGKDRYQGGRFMRIGDEPEPPSNNLSKTIKSFNFPMGRMKTGTPARLSHATIDYSQLTADMTDSDHTFQNMSLLNNFKNVKPTNKLISCYLTDTNSETHRIINSNMDKLPHFDANEGFGVPPRYCPSIELKLIRFPHNSSHRVFLEREGYDSDIVYPNGVST